VQTINPSKTRISVFLRWLRNPKICRISTNVCAVYIHVNLDNSLPIARNFSFVSIDETNVSGDIFYRGHPVVFSELQNKQVFYICRQTQQYI
jgi:hypothetical protein